MPQKCVKKEAKKNTMHPLALRFRLTMIHIRGLLLTHSLTACSRKVEHSKLQRICHPFPTEDDEEALLWANFLDSEWVDIFQEVVKLEEAKMEHVKMEHM